MEKPKIDYLLLVIYLLLLFLGVLSIYSAKFHPLHPEIFSLHTEYGRQLMWAIISLALGFAILVLDIRFLYRLIYPAYIVSIVLLLVVLFTEPINGARSWFRVLNFLSFQPSELAKLSTSLIVARYLGTQGVHVRELSTRLNVTFFIGLPIVLITLQPDIGTVLVFLFFILVLYREGLSGDILFVGLFCLITGVLVLFLRETALSLTNFDTNIPAKWLLVAMLLILSVLVRLINYRALQPSQRRKHKFLQPQWLLMTLGAIAFVFTVEWSFQNILKAHHRDRINLLLGLLEDKSGVGYNIHRALTAIGSGQFWGKGYKNSILANDEFKHVPEQGTDFIFCSIGEEWGFVGSSIVVLLFTLFLTRIIWVAEKQKATFARVYAYCVAAIFFAHFLINIGMVIGVLPVIGIPLPFFSYGGSSLICFSLLFFLLLRFNGDKKLI